MKPGRNDPCPCGSGKKFKHCCLAAAAVVPPQELLWRRLRQELEEYPARMLHFVVSTYGPEAIHEAWHEFWGFDEMETDFDDDTPHMPVFMPWFFHHWSPDPDETLVADAALHEVAPTRLYLARKGRYLDPAVRQYLESCVAATFSFFEVLQVDPGHGIELCDVFTGETHRVREQSATHSLRPGHLTYALLAEVEGLTMLEASAPVVIRPIHKIELIDMRGRMQPGDAPLSQATLRDWDFEVRKAYLGIADELLNPPMPVLQTTDGEVLAPQNLVFDIESAEEALHALKSLDFESTEADPLEEVERDATGALKRAAIVWKKPGNTLHAQWTNAILGQIEITPGRMVAEVNSDERADAFRGIVENKLGGRARYRLSEVQPLGGLLSRTQAQDVDQRDADHQALLNAPEVQAYMQEYFSRHYEQWVEQPIPVLGGLTPIEAVKDPQGREKVEALVRDIERAAEHMHPGPDVSVFHRLRERLGMRPAT